MKFRTISYILVIITTAIFLFNLNYSAVLHTVMHSGNCPITGIPLSNCPPNGAVSMQMRHAFGMQQFFQNVVLEHFQIMDVIFILLAFSLLLAAMRAAVWRFRLRVPQLQKICLTLTAQNFWFARHSTLSPPKKTFWVKRLFLYGKH